MSEFKAGDRVRVVRGSGKELPLGLEGTVKSTFGQYIRLANYLAIGGWNYNRFELIKEESMSKFKVGDKVEVTDGKGTFLSLGDKYTVSSVSSNGVQLQGINGYFVNDRFKLVESNDIQTLIDEANKGMQSVLKLMDSDEYLNRNITEKAITKINSTVIYQYELKKKEFKGFNLKEGWRVALDREALHIGCKKMDYKQFMFHLKELLVNEADQTVNHQYRIKVARKGLKFCFDNIEEHMLSYESAEQILKALEEYV